MNGRKEEEQNRTRFAPCCLNREPRKRLPRTLPAALCSRHPSVLQRHQQRKSEQPSDSQPSAWAEFPQRPTDTGDVLVVRETQSKTTVS